MHALLLSLLRPHTAVTLQSMAHQTYSDNESATILGNVKGIESTRELVVQHAWFLSRLFDFQM